MKAHAWIGDDGEYLGVTGAGSLDEMAAIVAATDEWTREAIADSWETSTASAAEVRAWLDEVVVHPVRVPASLFHEERWDGSHLYPCAIDAKPGRGFVKVLGVFR